jgi:hypothetical protein
MSNDINVQSVGTSHAASDPVAAVKPAVIPPPEPQQSTTQSAIPNPRQRLDPALGLVVLEWRSDTGAVTRSIPSQSQLQAYQRWDVTHSGQMPVGRHRRDEPAPTRQAEEPRVHSPPAKGGETG